MARVPKGGAGSSRGIPRTTGQAHRSAGTELINEGFGKAFAKSPVLLRPFRAFFDGVFGTSHHNSYGRAFFDGNGERVKLNPFQKQLARSRANFNTLITGRRTHAGTGEVIGKDKDRGFVKGVWNRAWSIPHAVSNLTLGMGLAGAGWVTRGAVGGTGYVGLKGLQGLARFTGATTLEAALAGKEIAKGGRLMNFPFAGDAILVGGTASIGVGGLALAMNEVNGVAKSFNGYASSLAGTTGMTPTPLVNTGADGDLVFAMHKLR